MQAIYVHGLLTIMRAGEMKHVPYLQNEQVCCTRASGANGANGASHVYKP